ncbi:DNA-binding transcriptional regulator, Lrp family [Halobiforma haloterrestris]|uniref:DNA-binding transcriptional regulator, Lrp family n=1 Tax=Natronobacterium haloterrestre TaxID=148448 RepID=A0A1I1JBC4_NATHA|nr:winged helix-turn-helix domain-containing protein [Halobiforma haloterrestris]SFC45909.1 DNA-binding transcriptional regulator, Lrp family [Halobiforma haloterrestris]
MTDDPILSPDPPEWEFKDRDIAILCELSNDPQLSSRELTDVLEAEYGIDVSHVTVSESIRRMRDEGVFREAIIPNEEYYIFALFEFKFNTENFADGWRDAMEYIESDKHTLFFFLSDGEYQWKTVMMFRTRQQVSKWIHEFYKEHGAVISNLRNSAVHNVLKFRTDPEIYEDLRPDDGSE